MKTLIIVLLLLPNVAFSLTGKELNEMCTDYDYRADGLCSHYVQGVIDGFNTGVRFFYEYISESENIEFTENIERIFFCPSDSFTYKEATELFIKHIDLHPESANNPADALLLEAMIETFPCPE